MKVLSTASTVSTAFKNASRVREIASVFIKYGFSDLINRLRLQKFIPRKAKETREYLTLSTPERLKNTFEELGPTFIKLGQLLSTRADLIPEAFIESFEKLQDKVSPIPFLEIKRVLEKEFQKSLPEIFESIEETPLAAASIAQVHRAVLKTGEEVVLKIQRPDIEKIIENDVSILRGIAYLLDKYVPETRLVNPKGVVEEFFKTTLLELDFRVEINNIRRISINLSGLSEVAIPKVYEGCSTQRVLCLEYLEGVKFNDKQALLDKGISISKVLETGADAFFRMILHDGLFHADPHAGNLFVLNDGRVALIDFGMVGRLSRRIQDSVLVLFSAIMEEDFDTLAAEYCSLCPTIGPTEIHLLQKDLMDTISPYIGMRMGEVNIGKILLKSTSIASRHSLQVPRELLLLFRAIFTLESLGRKLDPTFDLLPLGNKLLRQVVSQRYSKERITHDLVLLGRDFHSLLETTPRLLRRFLRKWSSQDFQISIKNESVEKLADILRRGIISFLVTTFAILSFIMGFYLLKVDQSDFVTWFGIPLSAFFSFCICFGALWQQIWSLKKLK